MKIDVKQLRIGNLLKRPGQEDGFFVDINTLDRLSHETRDEKYMELTDKVMKRFGFAVYDSGANNLEAKHPVFPFLLIKSISTSWRLSFESFNIKNMPNKLIFVVEGELEYAHQLQNLCLALTGHELVYTVPEKDEHVIKFVASSKTLDYKLSEIKFHAGEEINTVEIKNNKLIFTTTEKKVDIGIDHHISSEGVFRSEYNWAMVRTFLAGMPNQPISIILKGKELTLKAENATLTIYS